MVFISADPEKDPKAEKFDNISFEEVINRRLKVMDSTAFTMCRDNNMPLIVFDMNKPGNLNKLVDGEKIGTLVPIDSIIAIPPILLFLFFL